MLAVRDPAGVEVVTWAADTEAEESERIAETIQRLHAAGLPYRDIAILVRGRVAYPALLAAFDAHGVPVQPAGRTGLFARPEAQLFGKTFAWLVGHGWSLDPYSWGEVPEDEEVFGDYDDLYQLDPGRSQAVRKRLFELKESVPSDERPVNLVGDFYELLADIGVSTWASPPIIS